MQVEATRAMPREFRWLVPGSGESVRLHVFDLDLTAREVSECRSLLDADERARADRFHREQHRRRWTVSRGRLREVLSEYCGLDAREIRFSTTGNGKPVLADHALSGRYHFNLSHAKGLAVVAVTDAGPIGVDLEREYELSDFHAVARRFFSPLERAQLAAFEPASRRHGFFCCWTRKEAVIKATGEGLSARLDSFDVSLQPHSGRLLTWGGDGRKGSEWRIHHFEPGPGYVGAVAVHRPSGAPRHES